MIEYDITKHEWQGGHEIGSCIVYDDIIELNLSGEYFEAYLTRLDAIAIAKHFKITPEDITN